MHPVNSSPDTQLRVGHVLKHMNSLDKAELKKLLPPKLKAPDTPTIRYPNALLNAFVKEEQYMQLGNVAEELLRHPSASINLDLVIASTKKWYPDVPEANLDKVRKSKTTQPFIDNIVNTRKKLEQIMKGGDPRFEETVSYGAVQGHPDIRTDKQIFEVKMTGMLKDNWVNFIYQVFSYGAIVSESTDIYLVFPMQELVWHYDVTTWKTRIAFRDFLSATSQKLLTNSATDAISGALVRELYLIGYHAQKQKLLVDTVRNLAAADARKPYQIFLSGPQNSKMHIADDELAAAASAIQQTGLKLFIHSQYLINLCQTPGVDDDYHTKLLIKNLQYGRAIGSKGVVVHVGKYTDKPLPVAMSNMRTNLLLALEHATPECPILLETPAGQGTETLQNKQEFTEFVLSLGATQSASGHWKSDPRIRVCVDTCHVFACGYQPLDYVQHITTHAKDLIKLIHYNDSATPCGSHLDRHAYMGTGHVGMEDMTNIAKHCHAHNLPMLIE